MRFALVRAWAVAAAAILAAAAADAGTEFAENSEWLGGTLRDNQHEAILPALLLGAAVTLSLTLFILLARISPRDPLLLRMNDLRARFVDLACALCGSELCVVLMEGYETRFGGLSPFDPRSVVISHAPALVIAFLLAGAIVHCALRASIAAASRASGAVAEFLVEFLRKLLRAAAPPRAVALSAFRLYVRHVPPGIAAGSRGLRAPPRSIRPLNFAA
ncbi:MAG TPA: hypothetical protein VFF63_02530 [Candidatus Babeliales bacterium]|nr:hypothetical protein [Candidatus Babeliales bacterium]